MSFIWPSQPSAPVPNGYERAMLDELFMLLDYVAGDPATILPHLAVASDGAADRGEPADTMPVPLVLSKLAAIKARVDNEPAAAITGSELSFLFLVDEVAPSGWTVWRPG